MFFIYINIIYMLLFQLFISAVGGFVFYKVSSKFLFPNNLSTVLGGVLSLLLGYSIIFIFPEPWLIYGVVVGLIIYILFVRLSRQNS